jgi:hypothetical protein
MKTCSALLKRIAKNIQAEGTINPVINFETKSHYGGPELVYVTSEHKDYLQTLTNSKTLTPRHVKALESLGFKFEKK